MKRIFVLLIAFALALSLIPAVFAAEGVLTDGDNELELACDAEDAVEYSYTATQTGTLYIMTTEFYSSYEGEEYDDSYATIQLDWWATELTVDGDMLEGGYYGSIEVEEGETYTFSWEHVFAGDFGWMAVINLSYDDELMPKFGTEEFPIKIYPDDCPMQTIVVEPGETAWYILEDFDGAFFVVEGRDAHLFFTYVDLETALMAEFDQEESGGDITAFISSSYQEIQITNNGNAARRYDLYYYYPEGSRHEPVELELGENVAYTEENNYDGYYFYWEATEDGVLYLTFDEDGCWRYRVINLSTNDYYDEVIGSEEDAENPGEIYVERYDEILIIVNSYDPATLTIPGGAVYFTASIGHEHEWDEGELTQEPDGCQGEGEITYTCQLCGQTYTETFPGEHMAELVEGREATCSEDGMLPHWYCASCEGYFLDEALTEQTTYEDLLIPATAAHEDEDGEWNVDENGHYHECACGEIFDQEEHSGSEANCVSAAICEVCGEEFGEIDSENHLNVELQGDLEATCTEDGYTGDLICNDCGLTLEEGEVIEASGQHEDADGRLDSDEEGHFYECACGEIFDLEAHYGGEATCATLAECDVCGEEYGEYNDEIHQNTEIRNQEDPTCSVTGYTGDLYCNDCGQWVKEGEVIDPTGEHVAADDKWKSDSEGHYHLCACGEKLDQTAHSGGTATCTKQAVCEICGASYGNVNNENHGQTEIRDQRKPTCAENGYTGDTYCGDCGEKIAVGEEILATGQHSDADGNWDSDEEGHYYVCDCGEILEKVAHSGGIATCTKQANCEICGAIYGTTNDSNHGATEIRNAVAETCSEAGYTGDTYCTACGEKVSNGQSIAPNGKHTDADGAWEYDGDSHWHSCSCGAGFDESVHTYGAWEIIEEAGQEDGLMRRTCVCGHAEDAVIPAQHEHSFEAVLTEPTCTTDGYTTHTCNCGFYYISDEVPGGHNIAKTGEAKDATCEAEGALAYWYCDACQTYFADEALSQTITEAQLVIPALPHTYEAETVAPSCTAGGYTTYTCSACGHSYVGDETAPAHVEDKREDGVEATCTQPGCLAYWHCSLCDGYFTESGEAVSLDALTIPTKDHTAGEWVVEVEPQIGVEGLQRRYCQDCGAQMDQEQIPALESTPATTPAATEPTAPATTAAPTVPVQTTAPNGVQEPQPQNNSTIIIVAVVAVLVLGGIVAVVIIKKKK